MATKAYSLRIRLLFIIGLVLLAGFAATVVLLDTVFRRTSEAAIEDALNVRILALIGVADPDAEGNFRFPAQLPEPRFASLGSGLYAEIVDEANTVIWRSPSATGMQLAAVQNVAPGQTLFERRLLTDNSEVFLAGFGFAWELMSGETRRYKIIVTEDLTAYKRQLDIFRTQLLSSFAALTAALLVAMWFAARSGLKPLRQIADEISEVEDGHRDKLSETYPAELAGVAKSLNALVESERQRMGRFRSTMDDLAHSLKTPLAVMHSEIESNEPQHKVLTDQISRMQSVVNYQLRRASAKGPRAMAIPQSAVAPVCEELASGLQKIHHDRMVEYELEIPQDLHCLVEQGDLYELLGNVMDNAWKYCAGKVVCHAEAIATGKKGTPAMLKFTVEDDGSGIPEDRIAEVLARGGRLEARGDVPGQGIGLAIVMEILELYSATIDIGSSALGGTKIELVLPA
jgi:two-component system sensor histidine kinase PhoQ